MNSRGTMTKPMAQGFFSQRPLLISSFAVLFLATLQLFLFRPYYALNDDTFKIFFTQGVGTDLTPSEFIGYSNPLWGHLFKTLFTLFPHVPWYGMLMLTVQTLSLWALLYAFLMGSHPKFKTLLFALSFFSIYFFFFTSIQFTITAILAAQSALFLLLCLWKEGKLTRHPIALGACALLFFVGSLIRLEALFLLLFSALPLLAYLWFSAAPKTRDQLLGQKAFLLSLILLVGGGALYNHFWYEKTPGWSEFDRFDHQRLDLMDYRINPYNEKNRPFYEQAGWSENDFHMFKDWYYMDKDLYDPAKMRELAGHFPRFGVEGKLYGYHSLTETLMAPWAQTLILYIFAFLLWAPPKVFRVLLFQFLWILALFTFLVYFLGSRDRVTLPILIFMMNAAILLSDPSKEKIKSSTTSPRNGLLRIALAVLILLCPLTLYSYFKSWTGNQDQQRIEGYLDGWLKKLAPQNDQLYVTWDSSFPYEAFNAFDNFDLFRTFHVFTLAVYERSPNAQRMLDRFGLKDLLPDLVDNPNVFLICWPKEGEMYRQYMREKHHREIYPEKTFDCPFFKVFRIHSKPPGPHGWPK